MDHGARSIDVATTSTSVDGVKPYIAPTVAALQTAKEKDTYQQDGVSVGLAGPGEIKNGRSPQIDATLGAMKTTGVKGKLVAYRYDNGDGEGVVGAILDNITEKMRIRKAQAATPHGEIYTPEPVVLQHRTLDITEGSTYEKHDVVIGTRMLSPILSSLGTTKSQTRIKAAHNFVEMGTAAARYVVDKAGLSSLRRTLEWTGMTSLQEAPKGGAANAGANVGRKLQK